MKLRILLSYHYYRDADIDELLGGFAEPPDVFADSGAFSAFSVGANVDLAGYAAWLHRWRHAFDVYANLDVIGDPVSTAENQRALEAEGLHPLPVFHGGEPWDQLDAYCEQYPYVALGGMVGTSREGVMRWLVRAFKTGAAHNAVFHGFGQTNLDILKSFPWYTVDSASWASAHRYGSLCLWDARRARMVKVALGDQRAVFRHADLVRLHGGDPGLLSQPGFGLVADGKTQVQLWKEREHAVRVNVAAWLLLEAWLQRRWNGTIRQLVSGRAGDAAAAPSIDHPAIYLADASWGHLRLFFAEGTQFNLEMLDRATR